MSKKNNGKSNQKTTIVPDEVITPVVIEFSNDDTVLIICKKTKHLKEGQEIQTDGAMAKTLIDRGVAIFSKIIKSK